MGESPEGRVFIYRESLKTWGTMCKSNSYSTAAVVCQAVTDADCDTCDQNDCVLVPKKIGFAKYWESQLPENTPHPDAPIFGSMIECPNMCELKQIAFAQDHHANTVEYNRARLCILDKHCRGRSQLEIHSIFH